MSVEPIAAEHVEVLPTRTLHEHEVVIQRHLNSFIEVANSLLAIKANRLYREAGHETFQDYCQKRWQMSARRANQLIVGATIADSLARELTEMGTMVPVPEVERQARALAPVPAAERADVWRAAVAAAGGEQPTTGQVQAAVDAHLGIDRGAGEADDREASDPDGPSAEPARDTTPPAPELAQHEDEGVADECPPPAAPSSAVGDLLENDAEQTLLAWRMSFTDKWKAITRLKMFAPADVAAKAEPEALDDLAGVIRNLNGWWAEIEELRRANRGLRVVNGGAR